MIRLLTRPISLLLIGLFITTSYYSQSNFKTKTIGNQVWMIEELKVTTFRNGDPIPEAKNRKAWAKAEKNKKPVYCHIGFNKKNPIVYNFYAIQDPRSVAPIGFRIPTNEDLYTLENEVGNINALQAKNSVRTYRGSEKNIGTNASGFNAYPLGYVDSRGYPASEDEWAFYWTIDKDKYNGITFRIDDARGEKTTVHRSWGIPLRCIAE